MKRFILSAFSVVLAAGAIAPAAQAFPQVDPAFKIQSRRLYELDARNKAEDDQAAYDTYEQQPQEQAYPESATGWQEKPVREESTTWKDEAPIEADAETLSLTDRRHALLDRS